MEFNIADITHINHHYNTELCHGCPQVEVYGIFIPFSI